MFHACNAIPISTWFKDVYDKELLKLIPVLSEIAMYDDVRDGIKDYIKSKEQESKSKSY